MTKRVVAALLLVVVAWGCTRNERPIAGANRIRLVDRIASARVDSAADRMDVEGRIAATTRTLVNARGIESTRLDWTRFAVDWDALEARTTAGARAIARREDPALGTNEAPAGFAGPGVVLLQIPTLGDRDHVLEVGFVPAADADGSSAWDGIIAFESETALEFDAETGPDTVVGLFSRQQGSHRLPDRSGGRIEFRTQPETTAIVLAILARGGGTIEHVGVARRTRLGGFLEHPISLAGDPRAQRVLIGDVRREAVIFAAPGSVRFQLDLPSNAARLRAAIAPIDWLAADARAPATNVSVIADSSTIATDVELRPETWSDVELDLARFAGRSVVIEFASEGIAEGVPFGIAIGTPVVEALARTSRPDVVLISLDTLRYDRTSLAGYDVPTTPRLQLLGAESAVFRAAFAPAAYTLPSHATILSGRLPDSHRVNESSSRYDAADEALLAVAFRAAGYVTAGFTAGGYVRPEFGLARGFESYRLDDPGRPEWREGDGPFTELTNESLRALGEFLRIEHGSPSFVFVHTYAAHDYWAPPALIAALGDSAAKAWEGLDDENFAALRERARQGVADEELRRRIAGLYDAGARLADEALGRVLDLLAESGKLDDAFVIVLSDHGEELFDRGRIGHGFSAFDEMLHVPFLIRGPGIEPARHDMVVSLADVAPTIREIAGIEEPRDPVDGRSLLPILLGGSLPEDGAYARILGEGDDAERALRGVRQKLRVMGDPFSPRGVVLHDLVRDPKESVDASQRLPAITEAMLEALRRRYRDQIERERTPIESVMSADTIRQLRELGYLEGNR